ncbi:hypothetical protein K3495_g8063 [Podosphaera aphanis]|nr:hypothetical protein K3495_g8063 [Podosphaera aphanis]
MAHRNDAKSLSDITRIASNPPNYPRNPAATPREPLTLYISRIPGTRDIILSTIKPLTKNVTVEDITACLYYLHLNTDTDTQSPRKDSRDETSEPIQKTLSRKPVPQPSLGSLDLSDSSPKDHSSSSITPKSHSVRRKPVGEPASRRSCDHPRQAIQTPCRRSLDSRPPSCAPAGNRKLMLASLRKDERQFSTYPRSESQLSPEPHHKSRGTVSESTQNQNSEEVFSITVVRRDPSSGAQWNVGVISGHPAIEETQNGRSSTRRSRKPYFDISVCLTTPGYLHFRDQTSDIGNKQNHVIESQKNLQKPRFAFERKVLMEGSSFWSRASAQRKRALSDLSDKYSATLKSRQHHEISDNHEVHETKESQSKGYVFISPWGGRCKFFTSSGGRSLWCQHTLPSPVSAGDSGLRQQAVVISELRFNIPAASLFTSSRPQHNSNGPYFENLSKYSSFIQTQNNPVCPKSTPHAHVSQSLSALYVKFEKKVSHRLHKDMRKRKPKEIESTDGSFTEKHPSNSTHGADDARLDLSVGREKAGGGSRGTHPKMGKIIVHDEGLKMLDLVVCANMAIWWSVWDSDSKSTC